MNTTPRTPRSVYGILAAGAAIGALSFAGLQNGLGLPRALAQGSFTEAAARNVSANSTESLAAVKAMDNVMANLAEYASPAVVHIRSESGGRAMSSDGSRMPMRGGQGSGFIFRPDGYIITNDHVVGGFDRVTVIMKDGREYPGKVTRAQDSDIAIVKVEASNLPTLAMADSDAVRPGQTVMAIGSPFGLENSVTVGHVSALGRTNLIDDRLYPDLIQTDTAINFGNSGGPLVDVEGKVVGVNTAIFSPTGGNMGIGFAIPSNQVKLIADLLVRDGKLTRSMMKFVPENLKEFEKKERGLSGGAVITEIQSDGPAAMAGLQNGDVVVRIGDRKVDDQVDLRNAMLFYRPGTEVEVEYLRGKERRTAKVKLVAWQRPPMPQTTVPRVVPRGQMPDLDDFFRGLPNDPRAPQDDSGDDVPPLREGRARLGVSVEDITPANRAQFKLPAGAKGAIITLVEPGSVAERLGLKPGDLVTSINDTKVVRSADLVKAMEGLKWGDRARVSWQRFSSTGQMSMSTDVTFR